MIIPIVILVLSVLFVTKFLNCNFLNYTKNFFLQVKNLFFTSPVSPLQPSSSPKSNPTNCLIDKNDDLKQVFDTFDKNGDGFITREELKESLNNMGIIVPVKEVEEMVEKLDSNKDGLIDLGEFKELFGLVKGEEERESEEREKVGDFDEEEDLKEAFKVFDENKDGLITVKELGLVLSSLGFKEGQIEEDCKEMIKKVDVDGDGMVNFDEFKMMMRASCSKSSRLLVMS